MNVLNVLMYATATSFSLLILLLGIVIVCGVLTGTVIPKATRRARLAWAFYLSYVFMLAYSKTWEVILWGRPLDFRVDAWLVMLVDLFFILVLFAVGFAVYGMVKYLRKKRNGVEKKPEDKGNQERKE